MLFLYNKKDDLVSSHCVEEMITMQHSHGGKKIRSKRSEDPEHVGDYRQRPEEYKHGILAPLSQIESIPSPHLVP